MIQIKIAKLGSSVVTMDVEDGATVEIALSNSGTEAGTASQIRINNTPATSADTLADGDVVTVVPPIRGGAI